MKTVGLTVYKHFGLALEVIYLKCILHCEPLTWPKYCCVSQCSFDVSASIPLRAVS